MANLGTPVLKNSTFNFDHSNITTCNFGAYQPILAHELIPKAKVKFRPVSMVRLTNMVAPTYGLMKLKTTCGFVPMRLVYPNFTQFLGWSASKYTRWCIHPNKTTNIQNAPVACDAWPLS